MVILGILAVIAVPKFIDLTQQAKISTTQAHLGNIRSALIMVYAQNASQGTPVYPSSLTSASFQDGGLPVNRLTGKTGIGTVVSAPSGTATNSTDGFWYIQATGQAGAYSDGTVDTSSW